MPIYQIRSDTIPDVIDASMLLACNGSHFVTINVGKNLEDLNKNLTDLVRVLYTCVEPTLCGIITCEEMRQEGLWRTCIRTVRSWWTKEKWALT